MNWERIVLLAFIFVVVIGSWAYWAIQLPFGPYDNGDDCSTDNPERDHADR